MSARQQCTLELNDSLGSFTGELIGAPLKASGELVFSTGMVGYSEAITDPSYFGQILVFTYPLIGNYGIPDLPRGLELPIQRGFESDRANTAGVIISVDSVDTFHWSSLQNLDNWLRDQKVPGIVGLDTRHLVHIIRDGCNVLGKITPQDPQGDRWLGDSIPDYGDKFFDPVNHLILPEVSVREPVTLGKGARRVGLIDCGVKWNIIRQLVELDAEVTVVPWDYDHKKIDCSGWLVSNGPGDPAKSGGLVGQLKERFEEDRPVLGICLGHQIVSLAAGFETKRMNYGHRSHNQPVYQVGTRRGYITSQNHGYEVLSEPVPDGWEVWFRNANDQSVEGIKHESKPYRSVQFHPEAAGGPRDTGWILEQFVAEID